MGAPVRIGVVLSCGGARGVYAHTGFLLALERMGVNIAAISGCSAGALVGGIYASGTGLRQWAGSLAAIRPASYWTPDSWPRLFWNIAIRRGRGYTGVSGHEAAMAVIRRNLTAQTFETCRIPFHCLAVNLTQGAKTLFSEGDLAPRIMASAAVPVFYRPVEIGGDLYSDGAVIEMSPPEAICCKYRLDALIIHHVATHRQGPPGMAYAMRAPWTLMEIVQRLLYPHRPWYLSDRPVALRHCRCGCGRPIVVIEPDLPEPTWPPGPGGPRIQAAALQQTLTLLEPHRDTILAGK